MTSLNFTSCVSVFDANVRVGDRQDEPSPFRNRNELLAELDRHGVQRALVYHAHSEDISPVSGNIYLEEWLSDDGRILPTMGRLADLRQPHPDSATARQRAGEMRSAG